MITHKIRFHGEIKKYHFFLDWKKTTKPSYQELCFVHAGDIHNSIWTFQNLHSEQKRSKPTCTDAQLTCVFAFHIWGNTMCLKPFTPVFHKWTFPSSNLDMSTASNRGFNKKSKIRMANSVDPDETARYEPSHLDLHCLHRYQFRSAGKKGGMHHMLGKFQTLFSEKKIRRNVIGWNCLASTKENLFHCRSCWEEFQTWCRR